MAIAQLNANKVNRRDDVLFYILNEIQNESAKETGENYASVFKEAVALKGPKPQYQNFNSHLLLLYIHFKSSGEKLSFN